MAVQDLGKVKIPIKRCFWHRYGQWRTLIDRGWWKHQEKTCQKCGLSKWRIKY